MNTATEITRRTGLWTAWLGLLLTVSGVLTALWPARSNCFPFAVGRLYTYGGYLVIHKSHSIHGWWPHALWTLDMGVYEEYVPYWDKRRWVYWVPPIVFRGRVKEGHV